MSDTTLPKNGQDVMPFNFEGYCVRAIQKDGKALFCAKDVAVALGYSDPVNAIKRHCKGVAFRHPLETLGGMQEARFITEPDVYRLITGSKLPAAEKFEKWVFEEVLPSIRKHAGKIGDCGRGRKSAITRRMRGSAGAVCEGLSGREATASQGIPENSAHYGKEPGNSGKSRLIRIDGRAHNKWSAIEVAKNSSYCVCFNRHKNKALAVPQILQGTTKHNGGVQ